MLNRAEWQGLAIGAISGWLELCASNDVSMLKYRFEKRFAHRFEHGGDMRLE